MIEMGSFSLLRPWWLIAFPALAVVLRMTRQKPSGLGDWTLAVDAPLLEAMLRRQGGIARGRRGGAILWAAALTILALSGPAMKRGDANQFRNLDAALIILDVSDGANIREAASAAQLILAQSGSRQLGLIVYAGAPYLASPLTDDAGALGALLFAVDDRTVPDEGTRPDQALALARKILREAQIVSADVTLISDGEGLGPASTRAATSLASDGHSLHTLFVTGRDSSDSSNAERQAAMAALAAAGRGGAGEAAHPDRIVASISSRAFAHTAKGVLQILVWRDYGPFLLFAAAALLLLSFRGATE